MNSAAERIQRSYYKDTADRYDDLHVHRDDPHHLALAWLVGVMEHLEVRSVLDVGSGTGRAVAYILQRRPGTQVVGLEPSPELRAIGAGKGLGAHLVDGDAMKLDYPDGHFDVVCEFGVLHHLPRPRDAVREMLRVARKAVFISDDNHVGCSGPAGRLVKRALLALGLWKAAYWVRSGGKGYRITESDGLAYPYSVFEDLPVLQGACRAVHCMNTDGRGPNLYTGAGHVALCGIKR